MSANIVIATETHMVRPTERDISGRAHAITLKKAQNPRTAYSVTSPNTPYQSRSFHLSIGQRHRGRKAASIVLPSSMIISE